MHEILKEDGPFLAEKDSYNNQEHLMFSFTFSLSKRALEK